MSAWLESFSFATFLDQNGRISWPFQRFFTENFPTYADGEVPSGVIDGANKVFTLKRAPTPPGSLHLYIKDTANAHYYRTVAFTLVQNTITMTTAPGIGSALLADYRY